MSAPIAMRKLARSTTSGSRAAFSMIVSRSSMVRVAPILPSSSTVVVTSFRCGTFATTTGSSASSAAARIGSVAFLAPEMRTSPSRGTPPWICSLSMSALRGFFGRQRLDRQGVYLATHELPQRAVHELVARETLLALELLCHHARGKMGVVIRLHAHRASGEACADQPRDVFGVHGRNTLRLRLLTGAPMMTG